MWKLLDTGSEFSRILRLQCIDAIRGESFEGQVINVIFVHIHLTVTHRSMEPPTGCFPALKGIIQMGILDNLLNIYIRSLGYRLRAIIVGKVK